MKTLQAVLDINVLVSALWTPAGSAAEILELVLTEKIIPCFDDSILDEYRNVLSRPRLALPKPVFNALIREITNKGISISIYPGKINFKDEADRKFYDTAKFYEAYLVTGNTRHYPKEPMVVSPTKFLKIYRKNL